MRKGQEQAISAVPRGVLAILVLSLCAQISLRHFTAAVEPQAQDLPALPSAAIVQSLFMGDGVLASRLLTLWLQARDTQSGALLSNSQRDYQQLRQWLLQLHQLDPESEYPLLLATRIYSQSSQPQHIRIALDTVNKLFKNNPQKFWRWQVEAAVLAKHRLKDKKLALSYAQDLAQLTPVLPYWAKDMQIILMQELGQREELQLLIGGLLDSGEITEKSELEWLEKQL